ncbi:hypothetical protein GcC1_c13151o55 [Golovinomyces cichoracearum]|uniref:Secreted protein n=1 Tax=Golovinomyces cichoracearum TaxID=62708 RepID=A0A420J3T2_9PEZI|nr:hypothetical protein GcC1_c13151o55 [Golovinomyces cichoracearum]
MKFGVPSRLWLLFGVSARLRSISSPFTGELSIACCGKIMERCVLDRLKSGDGRSCLEESVRNELGGELLSMV